MNQYQIRSIATGKIYETIFATSGQEALEYFVKARGYSSWANAEATVPSACGDLQVILIVRAAVLPTVNVCTCIARFQEELDCECIHQISEGEPMEKRPSEERQMVFGDRVRLRAPTGHHYRLGIVQTIFHDSEKRPQVVCEMDDYEFVVVPMNSLRWIPNQSLWTV